MLSCKAGLEKKYSGRRCIVDERQQGNKNIVGQETEMSYTITCPTAIQ